MNKAKLNQMKKLITLLLLVLTASWTNNKQPGKAPATKIDTVAPAQVDTVMNEHFKTDSKKALD